jgi:hypothetical protein
MARTDSATMRYTTECDRDGKPIQQRGFAPGRAAIEREDSTDA